MAFLPDFDAVKKTLHKHCDEQGIEYNESDTFRQLSDKIEAFNNQ